MEGFSQTEPIELLIKFEPLTFSKTAIGMMNLDFAFLFFFFFFFFFFKIYCRHYEMVSTFNVKTITLLHQNLSEPEFYGDLVYNFKIIK